MTVKTLALRNGSVEAEALVEMIMRNLRDLFETDPIVFYELAHLCRDKNHDLFAGADTLRKLNLLRADGTVHESIRNIVVSATEIEGSDVILVDPINS